MNAIAGCTLALNLRWPASRLKSVLLCQTKHGWTVLGKCLVGSHLSSTPLKVHSLDGFHLEDMQQ